MWGSGLKERRVSCLSDGVRFVLRTNAHRTTPPASWRGPRLIDDETVAKMGHPDLWLERAQSATPKGLSAS
jgi:hypothetical protein